MGAGCGDSGARHGVESGEVSEAEAEKARTLVVGRHSLNGRS